MQSERSRTPPVRRFSEVADQRVAAAAVAREPKSATAHFSLREPFELLILSTTFDYWPDSFGNLKTLRHEVRSSTGTLLESRTISYEYENHITEWLVGLPTQISEMSRIETDGTTGFRTTQFAYSVATGLVRQMRFVPTIDARLQLTTTFLRDTDGQIVEVLRTDAFGDSREEDLKENKTYM